MGSARRSTQHCVQFSKILRLPTIRPPAFCHVKLPLLLVPPKISPPQHPTYLRPRLKIFFPRSPCVHIGPIRPIVPRYRSLSVDKLNNANNTATITNRKTIFGSF